MRFPVAWVTALAMAAGTPTMQVEMLAQQVEERGAGIERERIRLAVDDQAY